MVVVVLVLLLCYRYMYYNLDIVCPRKKTKTGQLYLAGIHAIQTIEFSFFGFWCGIHKQAYRVSFVLTLFIFKAPNYVLARTRVS